MKISCSAALVVILGSVSVMPSAFAQTAAVVSSAPTSMTWAGLTSLVEKTSQQTDSLQLQVDQIKKCGAKRMSYVGTAPDADKDGCAYSLTPPATNMAVSNATKLLNSFMSCGQTGLVYAAATNSCVPSSGVATCRLNSRPANIKTPGSCAEGVLLDTTGGRNSQGTCVTLVCK